MGKNQPLPVAGKQILAQFGIKPKAASGRQRFCKEMHLRIMPKRLKMSDALRISGNRLPVDDASGVKTDVGAETGEEFLLQNLQADGPHYLQPEFPKRFLIDNVKRRIFLLKKPKLRTQLYGIHIVRNEPVGEHRL